jgi:hypothetical protein
VLIAATVAPATDPGHRATLLSADSLAGRLGYGVALGALTVGGSDDPQRVLGVLAVVSWALVVLLVGTAVLTDNLRRTTIRRRGTGKRRSPSRSPRRARRSAA